jgi:hypothetical protein
VRKKKKNKEKGEKNQLILSIYCRYKYNDHTYTKREKVNTRIIHWTRNQLNRDQNKRLKQCNQLSILSSINLEKRKRNHLQSMVRTCCSSVPLYGPFHKFCHHITLRSSSCLIIFRTALNLFLKIVTSFYSYGESDFSFLINPNILFTKFCRVLIC